MKAPLLTAIAVSVLASSAGAQQFVMSTPFAGSAVWTDGVAFADVDGDGDTDVLFANGSGYGSGGAQPQHLFLNNGNATFVAAHGNLNVANFNAKMVIAEDFDNDGDLDLMYAPEGPFPATTQRARMLINNGSGVFSDQSLTRLPNLTMASFCVCAGDVDDDGDLDVVFTNGATFGGVATQARLFENDGNGFFTDATAARMPVDTYNAQDVTLFDWDGDADIDIALSGKGASGKRGRLYLNDGTGVFTVSNVLNNLGTGATYEIDWGDLNGDGNLDGLVQSITGQSEGWARNNVTSVTNLTFPSPNGNDDNEMAGMDYDNDGDVDVFVGSLAGTEKVYRNNGNGTFTSATASVIQAQSDATLDLGFADLDGDGDYDMVTGQGEGGNFTNRMYTNGGSADTLPPVLVNAHTPSAIGASGTVFHVHIRDSIADDGKIYATTSLAYVIDGSTNGTVPGVHMGGGLFRAVVPSNGSTFSISATWSATDSVGNGTSYPPTVIGGINPWTDLGNALAGTNGLPVLVGTGPLTAGSNGSLSLSNALPSSLSVLFIGLTNGSAPLLGGILVPVPPVTALYLNSNPGGGLSFPFVWPVIAPGTKIYLQYVIQDPGAIFGAAISNAVEANAQ